MRVLITGGAGFIASHIADALIENEHDVVVVDNLSSGSKQNLNNSAKFYELDINDFEKLENIFKDEQPEIVYHYAAQIDAVKSIHDPIFDAQENLIASIKLLELCKKYNIKKFIFPSSAAVFGEQQYFPADENHPLLPVSPYGIHKLAIENYLYYFYREFGINYIVFRYANIYGPRQNSKGEGGVVAIFADAIVNNKQCNIYGDGEQTRDFVYVKDIAQFNVFALNQANSGIYNIGTENETSINELFNYLSSNQTHYKLNPKYLTVRSKEQRRSSLTYSKAAKDFAYKPEKDINSGLSETLDWFQNILKNLNTK